MHPAVPPLTPAAAPPADAAVAWRFGRFELQPGERRLLADGAPVPLTGRALAVLCVLVERAGQLTSRQHLIDRVWAERVVEENNLSVHINALRKALGPECIATVPGYGYRFTVVPEALYPAAPASAREGAAAPAAAPLQPAALPSVRAPLTGRDGDLAALGRLVDAHTLVTLVGAGGVGKTRLAQALLDARRQHYPHGTGWVELGGLSAAHASSSGTVTASSAAQAVAGAVADALGLPLAPSDTLARLGQALGPLNLLLVLDNAEHLLDAVAQVAAALGAAAPGLRLLVTSQAPLRLAHEQVMRLAPLAVPAAALSAQEALGFGSVAMFVERARAADAHFALVDGNAGAVIALCRALDGLPLAIELAAARAPFLGVAALLAAVSERLNLLNASRDRSAPARQQTLRAALAWSHELLAPREQVAWRRLGVVAGSAALPLIQQLLCDEPGTAEGHLPDEWAVLDALGVLVDRSLVAVVADAPADPLADPFVEHPRYRLLDSPRAFALERLAAAGETQAVRRRHMSVLAEAMDACWQARYDGATDLDLLHHRVLQDLDNARDALATAGELACPESVVRIGATLLQQWTSAVGARARSPGTRHRGRAGRPLPAALQLRASMALGLHRRPRGVPLRPVTQQAVALARQQHVRDDDGFPLYHALSLDAVAAASDGELAAATAALDEMQALEDPRWPAQRRYLRAYVGYQLWVQSASGDAQQGLRLARRSLDLAQGPRWRAAVGNVIEAELKAGDAEAAVRTGLAALAALEGSRHAGELAYARLNLVRRC